MKTFIILLNKIVYRIGKWFHKGSSMPGKIALRLDKNILKKIKLPKDIIMITGSNGKTSTTEMIAHVLMQNGFRVGWNKEGSNQIEGVTTMILNACHLNGKVQKDVLVMEVDERYLRFLTKYVTPTYLVVTNLFRDQMTRNGHPQYIFEKIKEGIPKETHLILNADDPLTSLYGWQRENVTYVGVEHQEKDSTEPQSVYNDGKYCPNCQHVLRYDYYHFAHIGSYHCENCGYHRATPDFAITRMNLAEGTMEMNGEDTLQVAFQSMYHVYNLLFAYAAAQCLGVPKQKIISVLNDYTMKNDRVQTFRIDEKEGMLLTSKHENSISYDQSIDYVLNQKKSCTVVVIVDAISRKYFTSETSWLWDIDFEKLNNDCVENIVLAGKYVYDLLVRFQYAGIAKDKIWAIKEITEVIPYLQQNGQEQIYVITCFSDRMKFLKLI